MQLFLGASDLRLSGGNFSTFGAGEFGGVKSGDSLLSLSIISRELPPFARVLSATFVKRF